MPNPNEPIPHLFNDDVIQGIMLSDGYITNPKLNEGNARIEVTQTPKRIKFLEHLKSYFNTIGLKSSIRTINHFDHKNNKSRVTCHLSTSKNPTITKMRKYWYPDGFKVIPNDLRLSVKSLAYLFMGDGFTRWHNKGKSIDLQLATYCFNIESCNVLKNELMRMNLDIRLVSRNGCYLFFRTANQRTNERFMNMIEPYIIPCFQYKIKHIPKYRKTNTIVF